MNTFLVQFGTGNPSTYAGLSPTFIVFTVIGQGNTTPPGITQVPTNTGLYYFNYTPLSSIAFVLDGTATITDNNIRYVSGLLDPATTEQPYALQSFILQGQSITVQGYSGVIQGQSGLAAFYAQGQSSMIAGQSGLAGLITTTALQQASFIGSPADSIGSTFANPTTIFGYLRRVQEFNEGNNVFTKTSGAMQYWSRGVTYSVGSSVYAGSSAMIASKTVDDDGSVITKD